MRIVEESLNAAEVVNEYLNTQSKIQDFNISTLEQCIWEAFDVPNNCLPDDIHNNTTGKSALARINKICDKKEGNTTFNKVKQEKARRVETYRKQLEETGEINFI